MKAMVAAAGTACLVLGVGAYFLFSKPAPPSEPEYGSLPEPMAAAPIPNDEFKIPKGVAPLVAIEAEFKRLEKEIRNAKTDEELKKLAHICANRTFDLAENPALAAPHFSPTVKWLLVGAFDQLSRAAHMSTTSENPDKVFKAAQESMDKAKKLGK